MRIVDFEIDSDLTDQEIIDKIISVLPEAEMFSIVEDDFMDLGA